MDEHHDNVLCLHCGTSSINDADAKNLWHRHEESCPVMISNNILRQHFEDVGKDVSKIK